MEELDRVLGGGLVGGEVVLLGGDPGIGKSTLLLQAAASAAAEAPVPVLYATGEESLEQIRLRAQRLQIVSRNLRVFSETDAERVIEVMEKEKPALVVVDSIQTLFWPTLEAAPGGVAQLRECTARITHTAKTFSIPVFLVGHVTKEGALAGPMVLEHMVDAVLIFEGDPQRQLRLLRAKKNRYGSTQEVGLFAMGDDGLREVPEAGGLFLEEHEGAVAGVAAGVALEGSRPFVVEVQVLSAASAFGVPQRRVAGFDATRLSLLLAVLEKHLGFQGSAWDVFLNLAGGFRSGEPALDLPVALAAVSSFRNHPLPERTALFGEVGLAGEVRAIQGAALRAREALRMGFQRVLLPHRNFKELPATLPAERFVGVRTLPEAVGHLLS